MMNKLSNENLRRAVRAGGLAAAGLISLTGCGKDTTTHHQFDTTGDYDATTRAGSLEVRWAEDDYSRRGKVGIDPFLVHVKFRCDENNDVQHQPEDVSGGSTPDGHPIVSSVHIDNLVLASLNAHGKEICNGQLAPNQLAIPYPSQLEFPA
jgi:hypothetical protein